MFSLIPMILGAVSIGSGIVQGISSAKNAKAQAQALQESTQAQVNERARQAKKLMSQQKTSFLKSGVYFDSGTPVDVINETYETSMEDINSMIKDTNTQVSNLMRQGKTAFWGSLASGVANGLTSYFNAGGSTAGSTTGSSTSSSFSNWYRNLFGNYRGGFGTASGTASTTRIV